MSLTGDLVHLLLDGATNSRTAAQSNWRGSASGRTGGNTWQGTQHVVVPLRLGHALTVCAQSLACPRARLLFGDLRPAPAASSLSHHRLVTAVLTKSRLLISVLRFPAGAHFRLCSGIQCLYHLCDPTTLFSIKACYCAPAEALLQRLLKAFIICNRSDTISIIHWWIF